MAQSFHCRSAPSLIGLMDDGIDSLVTLAQQADSPYISQADVGWVSKRLSGHQTAH